MSTVSSDLIVMSVGVFNYRILIEGFIKWKKKAVGTRTYRCFILETVRFRFLNMRERDLFFRKKNANVILALHFLLFHVLKRYFCFKKSTREFMRIYSIKL